MTHKERARENFTDAYLKNLSFSNDTNKPFFLFDQKVLQLGVKVSTRRITHIVEGRVSGEFKRVEVGVFRRRSKDNGHWILGKVEMSVADARKKATGFLALMAKGVDPNQLKKQGKDKKRIENGLPLKKAVVDFFEAKKAGKKPLAPETIRGYKKAFNVYLKDWLNISILNIDEQMIHERFVKLTGQVGPAQANQGMKALSSLYSCLKKAYKDVSGKPIVLNNPVNVLREGIGWNKIERRNRVIPKHKLGEWLKAALKIKDKYLGVDYLILTLFTGMRPNEGRQLVWSEVDLETGAITLPPDRNKKRQTVSVPLPGYCWDMLKKMHERKTTDFVFPGEDGTNFIGKPASAQSIIKKMTGLTFAPYDLRRTFCTVAEFMGFGEYTIKRLMRHAISDVTGGYIRMDSFCIDRLREPINTIADFILSEAGLTKDFVKKIALNGRTYTALSKYAETNGCTPEEAIALLLKAQNEPKEQEAA